MDKIPVSGTKYSNPKHNCYKFNKRYFLKGIYYVGMSAFYVVRLEL